MALGGKRRFVWCGVLALALATPLAAGAALHRAVASTLVPALERATGEPASVGRVEVSLLGAVRLEGIEIGDLARARAIEARVSLGSLVSGRLGADELAVESPQLRLRRGGRRLRALVTRLHRRHHGAAGSSRRSGAAGPAWPRLRVSGGQLSVTLEQARLEVRGVTARPQGGGLRIDARRVALSSRAGGQALSASFGPVAADLDTKAAALRRAVALGGTARWGVGEAAVEAAPLAALFRHGTFEVRGGVGGGRVRLERRRSGRLEVELADVPGEAMGPVSARLGLAGGRVGGRVAFDGSRLTGRLELDGVSARVGWLASEPVDVSGELSGDVSLERRGEILAIEPRHLRYRRGPLELGLGGELSWNRHAPTRSRGHLVATLAPVPCDQALAALPPTLVSALRGMRVRGSLEARVAADFDLVQPAPAAMALDVDLDPERCRVETEPPGFAERAAGAPGAAHLPAYVAAAFVAAEDARFRRHHGFDLRQIEISLAQNLRAGQLLRGGSTITQQLAKNLFLDQDRTVARKLQEAVLAWRLEAHYDKSALLSRYLQVIQLGETVRGIDAAALHWFARPATELSPRQAAFLACLTRAPASSERSIREGGGPGPNLVRRIDELLASLRYAGVLDKKSYAAALDEELPLAPLAVAAD